MTRCSPQPAGHDIWHSSPPPLALLTNPLDYARTVVELAQRRELVAALRETLGEAHEFEIGYAIGNIVARHESRLAEVGRAAPGRIDLFNPTALADLPVPERQWLHSGGLRCDGVPWNNNNAEHAIKFFAKHRRDANGKFTEEFVNGVSCFGQRPGDMRVQQRQCVGLSSLGGDSATRIA